MIKIRLNKKGMTLVEVIVASVIMVIVIGISGSILISGTNLFGNSENKIMDQELAANIVKMISEELRFASKIEATGVTNLPSSLPEDQGVFFAASEDGSMSPEDRGVILNKKPGSADAPQDIYKNRPMDGREIAIRVQTVKADRPKAVKVFVDVYRKDKLVFTDSVTIQTPNIAKDAPPLKVDASEPKIPMIIFYEFPADEEIPEVPPAKLTDLNGMPAGPEKDLNIKDNAKYILNLVSIYLLEQRQAFNPPGDVAVSNTKSFDIWNPNSADVRYFDSNGTQIGSGYRINLSSVKSAVEVFMADSSFSTPVIVQGTFAVYFKQTDIIGMIGTQQRTTYELVPHALEFKHKNLTGQTNSTHTYFLKEDRLFNMKYADALIELNK